MRGDFETRMKEMKERWEQRRERRSRHGHIWTGLFVLMIGVAALVKASVTDLPDWVFSWKTFLIVLGLFVGIKHRFKGGAWFILMLVGGAFLYAELNPDLAVRRYIWPVVLILVGAILIFRPRRRCMDGEKKNYLAGDPLINPEAANTKEDFVDSTSIFGGAKKNIISKNFKGGDIVNIFGGTELDLTQADMNGQAIMEITTIFGGTKLIIPSNWEIKSEAVMIFGGIEDKRKMQTVTEAPTKVLVLQGTVIFGGIDIKSY
jgi:predicted membrane protein